MKKIFFLIIIAGLTQAMEPALKLQPSLMGLPTDIQRLIFDKIAKRKPTCCIRCGRMEPADIQKASTDLKAFLLINKHFSSFANPQTINALIVAFGTQWTDQNFGEAASALRKRKPFEFANPTLAVRFNALITQWERDYADFAQSVHANNWEVTRSYIQQGFPIHDIVNATLCAASNNAERDFKFDKLIDLGADPETVRGIERAHFDRLYPNPYPTG